MIMQLPSDPMLLLSVVNTKLRDYYSSLDALCEDMQIDKADLEAKLASIGYKYDSVLNRFS